MVKKIVSVVLVSVLLSLSLSGCGVVKSFFTYWDGMTKSEVREYVQTALKEKYGEEFVVKHLAKTGANYYTPSALLVKCSPKSDESIVFDVEVDVFGKEENHSRVMYDTYIQSIVGREMRIKAEQILSKYVKNFAVEVYVRGLSGVYDSKIRSADKATIENFTNALPENNASTIWIAFDQSEFNSDYERVTGYVKEIVDEYYLTNGIIKCYFVSTEIVDKCKTKIAENHIDYYYDLLGDMEVTLSSHGPMYTYHFKGNDDEIYQTVFE